MAHKLFGWIDEIESLIKQYKGYISTLWAVALWLAGATLMGLWFDGRHTLTEAGLIEVAPAPELVIVALDEVFAEHHDFPRETPKEYLADVVRAVAAYEPRVVALDYWLTNADLNEDGFEALVQAVEEAPAAVQFVFPTRLLARPEGYTVLD
ncbi:MAG: CHASE2 domain-containing protein, partial [Rhodothermaceae bacterium]|nr:CHASE2 domain-containing protein [Rhodothermaceae bacterium]